MYYYGANRPCRRPFYMPEGQEYENILEEKAVTCFPNRNSDFVVLLSEVDEPMVVSTSELTNGERVKLTEKD